MQQVQVEASEDDEVDAFPAAGKQHDMAYIDRLDDTRDAFVGVLARYVAPAGGNPNRARQQARRRFRALADGLPHIAWMAGPDGSVDACNRRWYDFTGMTVEQTLGAGWEAAVHPEDRPSMRARWQEALGPEADFEHEYRLKRGSDGAYRWHLGRAGPMLGPSGRVVCWLGTAVDIDDQKRASDRTQRLQTVTAALSEARTADEVAAVIVTHALASVGARFGVVAILNAAGTAFETLHAAGNAEAMDTCRGFPVEAPLPIAVAVRTGAMVVLETWEERAARYPQMDQIHGLEGDGALVAIPMLGHVGPVGGLGLSFPGARTFTTEDRAFLRTLAELCAQALERARLYDEEHAARQAAERAAERAGHLQAVTAALSGARTSMEVATVVVGQGVAAMSARVGFIVLLAEDGVTLEILAPAGYRPDVRADWRRFAVTDDLPIAESVRTGVPIYIDTRPALTTRYPELAASTEAYGSHAWASLPLQVEGRTIGALGLSFPASQPFGPQDRAFLTTLADVCAQALERARLYEAMQMAWTTAEAERHRLQQVLDVLPEAIQIVDAEGHYLLSNRAANALLGVDITGRIMPREAMDAYQAYGVRRLDGTPYPTRALPLQRALLRGEEVHGDQQLLRHATTGQDIPILVNAAPLRDPAGAIVGAVAVFQDISAIRALERQRDEFVATVSHDLKNPLTSIVGMTQLLQRQAGRLEAPERTRFVEGLGTVITTAQRMALQINELLDMTHLQMGRPLDLDRAPADLVALLTDLVREYQETTEQHTLRLETGESTLVAMLDAARLSRALANVLANAIKFSPGGGIIAMRLSIGEEATGSWAGISIADQGMGIPSGELPKIWEQYYRASNVVGRVTGTGLGLVGVRQIVEQHGGTIAIASEVDRGTTVTIRLPLLTPP